MQKIKLMMCTMIAVSWLLLSSAATAAISGLPDFTELVADNGAAVVNISTKRKVQSQRRSGGMRGLPPGTQLPEGTPLDDLFRHFFPDGIPGLEQGQGQGRAEPRKNGYSGGGGDAESYRTHSLGSGFVLSKDGYILTNHHVIDGADEVIVSFSDKTELEAEVLGSDARSDVALLKVDATNLTAVKQGDSSKLKVGEWVLAIGSPFGFDASATAGIVSALGRSLPNDSYVPFIQTDVAINPGNSGGPLFNLAGEVIGINSQIYSRSGGFMGVSFAIPMDVAMEVVAQIKSQGYVSRGWLGVIIQNVTAELAESFGLDKPQGALVAKILPNSPAEKAGIEVGDVILKFNGDVVLESSALPPMVGRTPVDKRVSIVVRRDGKSKTLKVQIEELPEDDQVADNRSNTPQSAGKVYAKRIGAGVENLTRNQRNQLDVSSGGVRVIRLETGAASYAGLREGDVILKLNGEKVRSSKHFIEIVKLLPVDHAIPMLVLRGGNAVFMALKLGE